MNEIVFNNFRMPVVVDCNTLCTPESFYHADRVLDFNVVIYVYEGVIYVTEDDIDYELHKGELLFLKHGVHHFGKYEIPKGTSWFYAHFYFDEIPWQNKTSYITLPKKLSGLADSPLEKSISDYYKNRCQNTILSQWNCNSEFAELLGRIAFYNSELTQDSLCERIKAFLRENISKPFSSKELERKFFLSYKRLAALFKAREGISMQQYQDNIRIKTAKQLLRSSLMPIGEIAARVGYNDPLYFSRRFKLHTEKSPREYRISSNKAF